MAKRNNFPKNNNNTKSETKSKPVEEVVEEVSEVEDSEEVVEEVSEDTAESEPVEENFGLKIIGCKSLRVRKTPEVKDNNVDRVVKSEEMLIGRKYNADWTILNDGNFVMSKFVARVQ